MDVVYKNEYSKVHKFIDSHQITKEKIYVLKPKNGKSIRIFNHELVFCENESGILVKYDGIDSDHKNSIRLSKCTCGKQYKYTGESIYLPITTNFVLEEFTLPDELSALENEVNIKWNKYKKFNETIDDMAFVAWFLFIVALLLLNLYCLISFFATSQLTYGTITLVTFFFLLCLAFACDTIKDCIADSNKTYNRLHDEWQNADNKLEAYVDNMIKEKHFVYDDRWW